MKSIESAVAQHYGDAELLTRILAGLDAAGLDRNRLQTDDLAPIEEFHIGGRKATTHAVTKMALNKNQHVLDIGCGIGGAARYIATQIGCRVSGIDLTPEYVATAKQLTELTGLHDLVNFEAASALAMPFADASFDAAITLHVAMNIPDRKTLYTEIARVMKPGSTLCIFDIMKKNEEELIFPVPWAQSAATSHLTTPGEMHTLLLDAGFEVSDIEDRTDFALDYFKESLAASVKGPPPLGIHLIMGDSAPVKFKNVLGNLERGRIAPVQMIAQKT